MSVCPTFNLPPRIDYSTIYPNTGSSLLAYDPTNQCPTIEGINYKYGMEFGYTVTPEVEVIEGVISGVVSAIKGFFVGPSQEELGAAIEAASRASNDELVISAVESEDTETYLKFVIEGKVHPVTPNNHYQRGLSKFLIKIASLNCLSRVSPALLDLGETSRLHPDYLDIPHDHLLWASSPNHFEVRNLFRRHGVDVDESWGMDALQRALYYGEFNQAMEIVSEDPKSCIGYAGPLKFDPKSALQFRTHPLVLATQGGQVELIEKILGLCARSATEMYALIAVAAAFSQTTTLEYLLSQISPSELWSTEKKLIKEKHLASKILGTTLHRYIFWKYRQLRKEESNSSEMVQGESKTLKDQVRILELLVKAGVNEV